MQERIEELKSLRDEGKTLKEIAEIFGCSRGAVSGIMGRNRDIFPVKDHRMSDLRKNGRKSSNKLRKIFHEALHPTPVQKPKEQHEAYDTSRLPYAVTLADLENGCKFCVTTNPKGVPNLMCNEIKTSKTSNWCAEHERRVFAV